jgi:hypothetical protein
MRPQLNPFPAEMFDQVAAADAVPVVRNVVMGRMAAISKSAKRQCAHDLLFLRAKTQYIGLVIDAFKWGLYRMFG